MLKKNLINNRNKIGTILLSLGLLILVIGFSYAFFIYNKTGLYTHTITGGKMKVIYDETTANNITIENSYPLTDKEAEEKFKENLFKYLLMYSIQSIISTTKSGFCFLKNSEIRLKKL